MGPSPSTRIGATRRRQGAIAVVALTVVAGVAISASFLDRASTPDADLRNGRVYIQDNLWSTQTEQYAVWVDADGTPFAGRRARGDGDWAVVDLSRVPGNPLGAPTEDDLHNVYVIAADSRGFIHVFGNMHNDQLRYIRSQRPGDLTAWEIGHIGGPSTTVTYPQLVALPDGSLLFWRRHGIAGHGTIDADLLSAGAEDWQHLGTILDGTATGDSPYIHRVAVDRSARIHLMFMWRASGDPDTNHDVGYATSDDGGSSWTTADGRLLDLPMTKRGAETILDTAPTGSGLLNGGGLAVDGQGGPHGALLFDGPGREIYVHIWHDGSRWRRQDLDGALFDRRPSMTSDRDGHVWMLGSRGGHIATVRLQGEDHGRPLAHAAVPPGWEPTFDTQAMAKHGRLETLIPDGREPVVEVIDLVP